MYGVGGGLLDFDAELQALSAKVAANGASVVTFFELETIFNRRYDGHVAMPGLNDDFNLMEVSYVPSKAEDPFPNPQFLIDGDRKIQLSLDIVVGDDGVESTESVTNINGVAVHDFVVSMANNPVLQSGGSQHTGGRVTQLIRDKLAFAGLTAVSGELPVEIFPDTFEVEFASGTTKTFFTGVTTSATWMPAPGDGTMISFDRSSAQLLVNQPGAQYASYEQARMEIVDLNTTGEIFSRMVNLNSKKDIDRSQTSPKVGSTRQLENADIQEAVEGCQCGFVARNGYMVLKLSTFEVESEDLLVVLTRLMTEAKEKNSTKLIVDLSSNGGGDIANVYGLLYTLFPSIEALKDQFDVTYNKPMQLLLEFEGRIQDSVSDKLDNCPPEVSPSIMFTSDNYPRNKCVTHKPSF